eukprot:scaffold5966_cov67-Phaeocystis_antarctica.AAC.4
MGFLARLFATYTWSAVDSLLRPVGDHARLRHRHISEDIICPRHGPERGRRPRPIGLATAFATAWWGAQDAGVERIGRAEEHHCKGRQLVSGVCGGSRD